MHHPKNKACLVEGCTAPTYGKSYCRTHKAKHGIVVISPEQRACMRSNCCDALCIEGQKHEYGKQYCDKCSVACCWHPHQLG